MNTIIKLHVGRTWATHDDARPVEFIGEKLATLDFPSEPGKSGSQNRGVIETLYRAEDGRLVVYIDAWSHWQGESDDLSLIPVKEADLEVGGQFEALGREAGFGRPLTLDEAVGA